MNILLFIPLIAVLSTTALAAGKCDPLLAYASNGKLLGQELCRSDPLVTQDGEVWRCMSTEWHDRGRFEGKHTAVVAECVVDAAGISQCAFFSQYHNETGRGRAYSLGNQTYAYYGLQEGSSVPGGYNAAMLLMAPDANSFTYSLVSLDTPTDMTEFSSCERVKQVQANDVLRQWLDDWMLGDNMRPED